MDGHPIFPPLKPPLSIMNIAQYMYVAPPLALSLRVLLKIFFSYTTDPQAYLARSVQWKGVSWRKRWPNWLLLTDKHEKGKVGTYAKLSDVSILSSVSMTIVEDVNPLPRDVRLTAALKLSYMLTYPGIPT